MATITFVSDIHLGNAKVPAKYIHKNLTEYLYPAIIASDLLVIGGDFFDTSLSLDTSSALEAITIFHEIAKLAEEHHVAIRVIRGTYTHDRDQLKRFVQVAEYYAIDFKYYDTIAADVVCGFVCGYLPDNLPYPNAKKVLEALHESLTSLERDCPHFDFVFGHGYFEHMLDFEGHKPSILYTADDFACVNYGVLFGHIHTHKVYKNVIYAGSFDRLAHGEEETKGFLIVDVDTQDRTYACTFAKNPLAMPQYTVTPSGITIDDKIFSVDVFIEKHYGNIPYGYLRISDYGDDRITLQQYFSEKYKGKLTVTSIDATVKTKHVQEKNELSSHFTYYASDVPTKNNVHTLLMQYLKTNKASLDISKDALLYYCDHSKDIEHTFKELVKTCR